MALTKRVRFEILRRDNHACRYCGASAPGATLTVDHVIPVALGGTDDPGNLVAACKDCNAGKSSIAPGSPMVEDIAHRAVEWGLAIERYNALQLADRKKRDAYVRRFEKQWARWWFGSEREPIPRPADWKATIWQFYGSGLPIAELEDAVEIAGGNNAVHIDNTFRYMCGVAWNKIERMHEGAKSLLEKDATDGR